MKPLGFGKNYFTFGAILAYSVQNKLQSQVSAVSSYISTCRDSEDIDLDEDDPNLEILESIATLSSKSCHCNCYYKLKTKITLLLNHYIPRCPYYTTYFAFRRTGVHPPLTNF